MKAANEWGKLWCHFESILIYILYHLFDLAKFFIFTLYY
jgi:hypothetical protein